MRLLRELIDVSTGLRIPKSWQAALPKINAEYEHKLRLLGNGVSIYGANTLTGHRDGVAVADEEKEQYNEKILDSHAIAGEPFYSHRVARHVSCAKVYNWCAGGSGVSPELFCWLLELAVNPEFVPSVPRNASYSCGDVIPAACWARDLLNFCAPSSPLEAGDAMALINGNFVVLGRGAELVPRVCGLVRRFLDNSADFLVATHCSSEIFKVGSPAVSPWLAMVLKELALRCQDDKAASRQNSVSLRATPQLVRGLGEGLDAWLFELDELLSFPSGNPLFDTSQAAPLSQASFLTPALSVKTGALIEYLLLFGWASVGRTQFLLSGQVEGVPLDGANNSSLLGLIQYPKLMMAYLEEARQLGGRRVFASGSATSYGIEDVWTQSLAQLDQLEVIVSLLSRLAATEDKILESLQEQGKFARPSKEMSWCLPLPFG